MPRGGKRPGAGRPKIEFCKRGHPLNGPDAVYITKKTGSRACRRCKNLLRSRSVARRKGELPEEDIKFD